MALAIQFTVEKPPNTPSSAPPHIRRGQFEGALVFFLSSYHRLLFILSLSAFLSC
jgi:hypothetical protein